MRSVFKLVALVSILLAPAVWGQVVAPISGQAINQFGQPLPFASVRVCSVTSTGSQCVPTSPIFLDYNLTIPAPNPYGADQFGNYTVYVPPIAAPNLYEVQLSPANGITWTYVVKGPEQGGGSGTINSFASGNAAPLFTTSVTNPNGPNVIQSFTLSNAPNISFFGNVVGSPGSPSYITFVAGSHIALTPSGGNTLTISTPGLELQHNGVDLVNQVLLNFNDTTPAAPGGNVNVTFQMDSSGKLSAYVPTAGGGGGCSTGGIPTTNGSVTGDTSSTNCGANNRISDTATTPARVSTFGFTNAGANSGINVVAFGDNNATSNQGRDVIAIGDTSGANIPSGARDLIGIGDFALDLNGQTSRDVVAIGDSAGNTTDGNDMVLLGNAAGDSTTGNHDFLAMGQGAGSCNSSLGTRTNVIVFGNGAGTNACPNTLADVIGIGQGAAASIAGSSHDIIGIGDGAGDNYATGSHDNVSVGDGAGGMNLVYGSHTVTDVISIGDGSGNGSISHDVVAIGNHALSAKGGGTSTNIPNSGTFLIGIGTDALIANTTGSHNVAIGTNAGANGFVTGSTIGNSNLTGSQNTWIGDFAGPNTTTQLSNTIALGYQAFNTASNQTVIGNSLITSLIVFGCPTGQIVLDDGSGTCITPGAGSGNTTSTALTTNTLPVANGPNSIIDSIVSQSADKSTLTIAGTGPGCISISPSQICLTAPPYYASVDGGTTTTTTGTFAVGTSGTIGSCSTFNQNQGVYIAGAGVAAANYIGTVVSCIGTTLTVNPATSTSVAGGTVVQHDDTAAFLAAFSAIAANPQLTGEIFGPDGIYLVNGPLLDTSGANAILPVPKIPNYVDNTLVDISIKGFTLPSWNTIPSGFVIRTAATTGNLFGGYDNASGGGFPNFTNVKLEMEKVTLQGPVNSGMVMVNATNILAFQGRHLLCNAPGTGTTIPTNAAGGCFFLPIVANEVQNELDDIQAGNFYTSYRITEHTHAGRIYAAYPHDAFVFDNQTTSASVGPYTGNSVSVDYLWEQNAVNGIVGIGGPFRNPIFIAIADLENITGNGILDASNNLYGIINANISNGSGSYTTSTCDAAVSGGIHLTIHYVQCQPESASSGGPPSGLIENWLSQEGLGSTLVNSGYDFLNPATGTAITWATGVPGFTGKVASYNGSTSIATAASSTGTNFTGTTPFSGCTWANVTAVANATFMSTLDSTSNFKGWEFSLNDGTTGHVSLFLVNNFPTNAIEVLTTATVSTGSTHLHCFTYDGSQLAAGITIYTDGVVNPLAIPTIDALSASIANGVPVSLGARPGGSGSFLNGKQGRVRVFNRLLSASEILSMFNAGPNAY